MMMMMVMETAATLYNSSDIMDGKSETQVSIGFYLFF